jgi:ribosomal protein S18 acetylase RimI-like enzyme
MAARDKPQLMALLADTPEFEAAEIPVAEEVIDIYLECPGRDYKITIAEVSSKIVGYICFGQTPLTMTTWDIYWMAVARDKRGMGIGAGLLKSAEEGIQKAGGKLALIETSSKPNYLNTRRFYLKKGYKRISRIRDFYAPGDHRLLFEKRF